MAETLSILKLVGYLLAIPIILPIILAIPLIILGKFTSYWLESTNDKKDKLSLGLLLLFIVFTTIRMIKTLGDDDKQLVALTFILLLTLIHFSQKELRNQGGFKTTTWFEQRHEYFNLGFKGAWRSEGHWGLILVISATIYGLLIQIIN